MKLEWMGQYRDFVEALVRFGNVCSQSTSTPGSIKTSVYISGTELQVLEYILENEETNLTMSEVADRLYIPHSTFSKVVRQLVEKGILERYRIEGNYKNIVIRASEKGREAYIEYANNAASGKWGAMFKRLDTLTVEQVKNLTDMFNEFSGSAYTNINNNDKDVEFTETLIKME